MTKIIFNFRLWTWGIGVVLTLVSRVIFENEHCLLCDISMAYNEIIILISFIPVAQIMLFIDLLRTKKEILKHLLKMTFLAVCFLTYIVIWVGCTGGG